jgi:3-oxoacyl-[acyl-carrier-protein] synthase III
MMLKTVCNRARIIKGNHWYNVDQFGNKASCDVPSVLSMFWNDIIAGDNIAMVIVGAGLAWAHLLLQFKEDI